MIKIAHRGLLTGPDKEQENNPDNISRALNKGYDVEIDLQIQNGMPFLGHDGPTYKTDDKFLLQRGLWIHAKSIQALRYCISNLTNSNYFFHEEDPVVITTHNWIWVHPKHLQNNLSKFRTIAVVPEYVMSIEDIANLNCSGVCSDYVGLL